MAAVTALAASLAMGAAVTSPATAVVPAPATAAGQGVAVVSPAASTSSVRTLITGDRVVTRTVAGRLVSSVQRAQTTGAGQHIVTMRVGGRSFVMPAVARPYLGRFLDLSLFEVSSKGATSGRIAVTMRYTGTTAPSLPGVTVTSAASGLASGYLTAASARTFGAALAARRCETPRPAGRASRPCSPASPRSPQRTQPRS